MDNKFYKVFSVDVCFVEWAADYIYVGAESADDIINHINVIYPPVEFEVEDWMDTEDLEDIIYKEENAYYKPYFSKDKMDMLIKEKDTRITEVTHMFTDTPYVILDNMGYYE